MLSFILFLIFGLIVGAVARFLMPGRTQGGWGVSMVLGIAGAMLGGFIGRLAGIYRYDEAAGFIMSVIGAMILVGIYSAVRRHAYA